MRKIREFFMKIKYAFQRAIKGYDDVALWNVNTYIATVIDNVLQEWLDKGVNSYPEKVGYDEWVARIEKIRAGFAEYRNNAYSCDVLDSDKVDEALELLKVSFYDLWD